MKLFGHPLHLMFIHFPSGLFPMDLVCATLYFFTQNTSFGYASFYAMSGGAVLGWVAVIFGTMDLLGIFEKKPGAMKAALIHGGINATVVLAYSVLALIQYKNYPVFSPDSIVILVTKAVLICGMIIGNYIGGSLIFKHKVSIEHE